MTDPAQSEPDNPAALRAALVTRLVETGQIRSPAMEAAFRRVPRHRFVPDVPLAEAYANRSIPRKSRGGRLISSASQPAIMAIMLRQLDLAPGHRVLEIGAGTGYNAALIAEIVGPDGSVTAVEIDGELAEAAAQHLAATGYRNVRVVCADGGYGCADHAPYDRIILTVGASDITPAWWEQLRPGGRLVLPLALAGTQLAIAFAKEDERLVSRSVQRCGFVTLMGDYAEPLTHRIPLGPDPGLVLEFPKPPALDAGRVYRLLAAEAMDAPLDGAVAVPELWSDLWFWLALQDPRCGRLTANADLVDGEGLPRLFGIGEPWDCFYAHLLVGENGLAALVGPPGEPAPVVEPNELPEAATTIALWVRQYGDDEAAAQRLRELVVAWQAAGRPGPHRLHVEAVPADAPVDAPPDAAVIEKRWSRLFLCWAQTIRD